MIQNMRKAATQKNYLQLKRDLVKQVACDLKTTPQIIAMAYFDLIGKHIYDEKLNDISDQIQFLDIESITPIPDNFNLKYVQIPYVPRTNWKI